MYALNPPHATQTKNKVGQNKARRTKETASRGIALKSTTRVKCSISLSLSLSPSLSLDLPEGLFGRTHNCHISNAHISSDVEKIATKLIRSTEAYK
jgi:hypothetical protein